MSIFPGRRALVADDSRAARIDAARLVEPYGFDVDLAEDGAAALRLLEERGAYDLVLVDIRMPVLDGQQLVRLMRARSNFTPVVVISSSAAARHLAPILQLGATDFLVKPFDPVQVRQAVGRALNLPAATLRPESPLALVEGSPAVAEALRAGLPVHVAVERVEPGEAAAAVQRLACRLVVVEARPGAAAADRALALERAAATASAVLEAQPGAATCLVTPDGAAAPGFDAWVATADLTAAAVDDLYPNALRPLVVHDDELVGVMGFRGALEAERTYFALATRRLRAAVALQAAAGAARLTVDLSRVPARTAAVERLAREAVEAAGGRVPGMLVWVAPAMRPLIERLGLPALVGTPDWRATGGAVFRWTPDLSVGVESIDRQHQLLFERISALAAAVHAGHGHDVLAEALGFLDRYVVDHFAEEEGVMAEAGYPARDEHRAQHRIFRGRLAAIAEEGRKHGLDQALRARVDREVCDWLYRHVHRQDRALGRFLLQRA